MARDIGAENFKRTMNILIPQKKHDIAICDFVNKNGKLRVTYRQHKGLLV